MPTSNLSPASLRVRLEALPARRENAEQGHRFVAFQAQVAKIRAEVSQAATAAELARQVIDDAAYKEVRQDLQKLARNAGKLRATLLAAAAAVTTGATSNAFAGLTSSAEAAVKLCRNTWKRGIDSKLKGRAEIAGKLAAILPGEGSDLRDVVQQLQVESGRLLREPADAVRVRSLLSEFDRLMASLQIEGAAGKFLQAIASDAGAVLEAVRDPEVQKFLTDHKLWGAFRVRLS